MRIVAYKELTGVGRGKIKTSATLKDFLLNYHHSLHPNLIPPLHLVNQILSLGEHDAGMSGGIEWHPFEINQDEYDEIVEDLLTTPHTSWHVVQLPDWVQNYQDWLNWRSKHLYGAEPG